MTYRYVACRQSCSIQGRIARAGKHQIAQARQLRNRLSVQRYAIAQKHQHIGLLHGRQQGNPLQWLVMHGHPRNLVYGLPVAQAAQRLLGIAHHHDMCFVHGSIHPLKGVQTRRVPAH